VIFKEEDDGRERVTEDEERKTVATRLQIDFVSTHFYPDVNVSVLLTILLPQLNCYSVMPTILFSIAF